jgi:HAD superfamily hydrolase (TIGR01459 family)
MNFLDALPQRYRLILCDIWGCVHNGVSLYPGVERRLAGWRSDGRQVLLLSNAPRPAETIEAQLLRLGLSRQCWDAVVTGGELGIAALRRLGRVGFIGTAEDRRVLEDSGLAFAGPGERFTHLACSGLDENRRSPGDYAGDLRALADAGVVLHCLNPDRIVVRGANIEPCAGALADLFQGFGGRVAWYGKPHRLIYDHALDLGGSPPPDAVLAIGDGLETDLLGAACAGIDCVYVSGGVHSGAPVPADWAQRRGLGHWRPVAAVDALG